MPFKFNTLLRAILAGATVASGGGTTYMTTGYVTDGYVI